VSSGGLGLGLIKKSFLNYPQRHQIFTTSQQDKKKKPFQGTYQTLTHGSQHLRLMVNIQLGRPGPTLQGFKKWGTKFVN